jgi:hypothetical protein
VTVSAAVVDSLGWAATAVFVSSYFMRATVLTRVQMAGALMWVAYGLLKQAPPVVAANLLVFGAAAWTAWRSARSSSLDAESQDGTVIARGQARA